MPNHQDAKMISNDTPDPYSPANADESAPAKDKRLSEVIRIQKRRSSFVMMDKSFLEDRRLSWRAKGILAYLLSRPDDWKVIIGDLINQSTDGKASVYSGLKELKESGYYEKKPAYSCGKIVRWDSTVYETPVNLFPEFLEIENLEIEKLDIENRGHNNNYINNNDSNNIQSSQSDLTGQTLETIRAAISYHDFQIHRPLDIETVDGIVLIILDAVMTKCDYITIDDEKKPHELVRQLLLQLEYEDIEYVIDRFKSLTGHVNKKKQYILTMLYNCKMERDAHYHNLYMSNR